MTHGTPATMGQCRYADKPGGACWRSGKAVEMCTCQQMSDAQIDAAAREHARGVSGCSALGGRCEWPQTCEQRGSCAYGVETVSPECANGCAAPMACSGPDKCALGVRANALPPSNQLAKGQCLHGTAMSEHCAACAAEGSKHG